MELLLLDFPVDLFDRSLQHLAALQRELDVIRVDEREPGRPPDRLARLVDDLDGRFVGYRAAMDMLDALVTGRAQKHDVVIPVAGDPPEIAPAIEELRDLLDEVDSYCEQGGDLLTRPTPTELLRFRRWLFDQIIGQLRGQTPVAWTPPAAGRGDAVERAASVDDVGARRDGSTVTLEPSGDLDLATAGRVREAIHIVQSESDDDLRIDLSRVDFIDSVGFSVLIAAHQRFERDHRRLEITVPERLRASFRMLGLIDVLHITPAETPT
jgi:anti-anti-sigma factor